MWLTESVKDRDIRGRNPRTPATAGFGLSVLLLSVNCRERCQCEFRLGAIS